MTIEVFIKKPEKVEVLKYDGTNYDEALKFAGETIRTSPYCLTKGDYIVKTPDRTFMTADKPNYAKQELLGTYNKDATQGVNPNVHMSLEKLQEFFEVPILDDGFLKKDVNKKGDKNICKCEQQNSNHTSKQSNFSLRDLVMKIAPKHIKYYIKRLEEYGFKLKYVNEAEIEEESAYLPFIVLEYKIGNSGVVITNRSRPHDFGENYTSFSFQQHTGRRKRTEFEVKDNNWREAFNKLVAAFPDEIMKNTNRHNTNAS